VIAAVARDVLESAGDEPRDLERVLVSVGTAEREEHFSLEEAWPRHREQTLRELDLRRVDGIGCTDAQLIGLTLDRLDDALVPVPGVNLVAQRAEVEPTAAVGGREPRALAACDLERLGGALRSPREEERIVAHGFTS
jgi:hypothetical protein